MGKTEQRLRRLQRLSRTLSDAEARVDRARAELYAAVVDANREDPPLSISEIARTIGVTRQGVQQILRKAGKR